MAGTSLLTLIDDIASILDDVAVMTKVAAKKTSGVLGDDLALNAQQVSGVHADRELPVVWAVAKGSFKNKLVLVPAALAISALAPWAIQPLLMVGGAFLCYEGFEKIVHHLMERKEDRHAHHLQHIAALQDPAIDMAAFEQEKVRGAIRTDFILSAEIIVISMGTVATASFGKQIAVLSGIAVIMTVGVYGLVAGIVKLDDGGLYLSQKSSAHLWGKIQRKIGQALLQAAPYLMKGLSIVGTAAMFMVGGGILAHSIPAAHDVTEYVVHGARTIPYIGGLLEGAASTLLDALLGMAAGAAVLTGIALAQGVLRRIKKPA